MRKKPITPYLVIFVTLLVLMSVSKIAMEKYKGFTSAVFAPWWKKINGKREVTGEELARQSLDNQLLSEEIVQLKEMYYQELQILAQLRAILSLGDAPNAMNARHRLEFMQLLSLRVQSIPARVIYRSPSSWNSSLWLDVGEEHNQALGKSVVAKNSPVLFNSAVIGVIEYVGKRQSRVRLITDSALTLSVRAARGNQQNLRLYETFQSLHNQLKFNKKVFSDEKVADDVIKSVEDAMAKLNLGQDFNYLAKGEIHGGGQPLWRQDGLLLEGTGFNYDFPDDEGPARDLRTGKAHTLGPEPSIPIVQAHDLLVTTGLDGVFPAGLLVAEVTSVKLLKEGDFFYDLIAKPAAGNLNEITQVFVLPARGYDADERPPLIGE